MHECICPPGIECAYGSTEQDIRGTWSVKRRNKTKQKSPKLLLLQIWTESGISGQMDHVFKIELRA